MSPFSRDRLGFVSGVASVHNHFSMPLFARFSVGFLVLPLTLIVAAGCGADSVILGSNHDVISASGLRRELVATGNGSIECWIARSPGAAEVEPAATVLFLPGQRARAESWTAMVAKAWGNHPVEVRGINYPGYGGSNTPGHLANVAPAAIAVFDAIHARFPSRPIFIHAASFGTAVGLRVARERPVAELLLQNPPPLKQLILGNYGWWNLWLWAGWAAGGIPENLDSLANAGAVRAPAVFIISTNDSVVPQKYQRSVVDAYAGPKHVIENAGAGHSDGLSAEAAAAAAKGRDWLWDSASHE